MIRILQIKVSCIFWCCPIQHLTFSIMVMFILHIYDIFILHSYGPVCKVSEGKHLPIVNWCERGPCHGVLLVCVVS